MVRTNEEVVYMVLSTTPRFTQGDTTRPTVRCASTWSGPFCASSSITKIAVSFQNREWLTACTMSPKAWSFEATSATGSGCQGETQQRH
jgi:hypothetical protein